METGDSFTFDFEISEELYRNFILTSGDTNILHTDETFAHAQGFPAKVMHGNILCAKLSWAIGKGLPTEHVMIANQSINFRKPFYLNDKIELKLTLTEKVDILPGFELTFTFKNQDAQTIANGKMLIKLL